MIHEETMHHPLSAMAWKCSLWVTVVHCLLTTIASHFVNIPFRGTRKNVGIPTCWWIGRRRFVVVPFYFLLDPFNFRACSKENNFKKLYLMTISVSRVEAICKDDYKRQKKLALLLVYFNVLAKAIKIRIYGELNPFLSRYLITEHKISFALAPCLMPKGHRIMCVCVHAKRTKVLIQPKCLQNGRISKLN